MNPLTANLGCLDHSHYLFIQLAPLSFEAELDTVPDPLLHRKILEASGVKPGTSGYEVYPYLRRGRLENYFGETTLTTTDQDSNLNLPVIGSLVYCESNALDHVATEGDNFQYQSSFACGNRVLENRDINQINLFTLKTCILCLDAPEFLICPQYAGSGKILHTLCQHTARVNSVKWIRHADKSPETELVSASSDGTAVVWSKDDVGGYLPSTVLQGHESAVTLADGRYVNDGQGPLIVVTASVDSTVRIWRRTEQGGLSLFKYSVESSQYNLYHLCLFGCKIPILGETVTRLERVALGGVAITSEADAMLCTQILGLGSGICLSLSLGLLPASQALLLACGTDDFRIQLFAENSESEDQRPNEMVKVDCLMGHEDWVRALDFATDDCGDLLLASGAQDSMVRLWRVSASACGVVKRRVCELAAGEDILPQERMFSVMIRGETRHFAVSLESVLAGHEGWLYGVNWHPSVTGDDGSRQPLSLLSSSLDKTLVLWAPDEQSGVWLDAVRLGEVGGNTLGFYGAKFSPDGNSVMAHGYQGSLHRWRYSQEQGSWIPDVTVGGHFAGVVDLAWEPGGQFLMSAGSDQTTRLHAPWVRPGVSQVMWYELARPQVHGYDMACLALLSRYRFVSGAEEKVSRAFQAPNNFISNFHGICGLDPEGDLEATAMQSTPHGASVPALGLSNKAVYETQEVLLDNRHVKNEYPEAYFVPVEMTEPPTEENLIQNTLWPEVQKLYGHGYELYSLAARPDGRLLASACKATDAQHAAILLWRTDSWQQVDRLTSHQLTVTQLSFSPDGLYLLSVSRDRRWTIFQEQQNTDGNSRYQMACTSSKTTGVHSRIIWCCAWSHDSRYFATGSRDGKVAVWGKEDDQAPSDQLVQFCLSGVPLQLPGQSVSALAFAPELTSPHVLAVGLDCGEILLYKWSPGSWNKSLHLDSR
uniref:Elongator complex protein 2 n=1 Tax=Timema monikensis TaxID=170555 RepID=A0A7R9HK77_9NEOP|nr:unnamed protein product [Timema monikensis]